jgi:transcriptional regulator with XRE-family HTH domain
MDRRELAEAAGLSYSYLSAIESGSKMPSPQLEGAIAAALGVSPAELLARANGVLEPTEPQDPDSESSMFYVARAAQPVSRHQRAAARLDDRARTPSGDPEWISPSGAHAELRVLLERMSAEDAAALVAMARRLVDRNPQPAGRSHRSPWSGSQGRELRTAAYLQFWTDYVTKVTNRGLDWVEGRRPEPRSYFTTASPIKGASLSASFARNRRIRHELYINRGSREANLDLLDQLKAHRAVIERAYGRPLDFEDPGQERRAVRIAEYRKGHISRTDEHGDYIEWYIECGLSMRRAIAAYLDATGSG